MVPDVQLLARMDAGDRAALELLYRRHAAWLGARLRARTPSRDLAEEALQDTFLAAWRGAGSFRGDGDVGAWLWGIAVRRLVSLSRKRRLPTVGLDDAGQPVHDGPGPEDVALGAEESERVRRAVARLPDDQRAAITAVVYQGLSVSEVARAANVAEGTVKSRLHRARARIAKELSA
jgi:RNA polymerase sigma-70 factor (ECF subfamily)